MTKEAWGYTFLILSQILIAAMIYIGGGLMYCLAYLAFVCVMAFFGFMADAEKEKSKELKNDNADA